MDYKLKYFKYLDKSGGGVPTSLVEQLNEDDHRLIYAAKVFGLDDKHLDDESYNLVAAMLHENGTIVYGLAVRSPLSSSEVHGEEAVISQARIYDHDSTKFKSLVCITKKEKFKSPCGSCRELLKHHYPNLDIIVPDVTDPENFEKLVKIKSKYLLPYPYQNGDIRPESKIDDSIQVVKI